MGDRPAKVDEKKSDRKLEREKKKRRHFLLKEKHENFVAGKKSEQNHVRHFPP